jgi:hypothetical protein
MVFGRYTLHQIDAANSLVPPTTKEVRRAEDFVALQAIADSKGKGGFMAMFRPEDFADGVMKAYGQKIPSEHKDGICALLMAYDHFGYAKASIEDNKDGRPSFAPLLKALNEIGIAVDEKEFGKLYNSFTRFIDMACYQGIIADIGASQAIWC